MICLVNIYRSRFHIQYSAVIPWQTRGGGMEYYIVGGTNEFAESSNETINQLGIYGIMTLEAKYRTGPNKLINIDGRGFMELPE